MNTAHVYRVPATTTEPEQWTARLGGPDGPSASGLTPIDALCALTLALHSARHPFDPSWSPDEHAPNPADAPTSGDAL